MKALEEIKDEVAIELHQCTFKQAYLLVSILKYDEMLNEVVKRYTMQSCEDLRERIAEFESRRNIVFSGELNAKKHKQSILNTEIILP